MKQSAAKGSTTGPSDPSCSSANGLVPPASAQVMPAHVAWLQQCFDQCQPDSWAAMSPPTAAADQLNCHKRSQSQQPHSQTAHPSQDVQAAEPRQDSCIGAAADHPLQPHQSQCLQIDAPGAKAHVHAGLKLALDLPAAAQSTLPIPSSQDASMVREAQAEAASAGQPDASAAQPTRLQVQNQCTPASSKADSSPATEAGQSPPKQKTRGRCALDSISAVHSVRAEQPPLPSLEQQLEQYP